MSRDSRSIIQQGELDGFCLLYAILNAFKAIYPGRFELDQQKKIWSSLIGVTPSLQNFASFGSTIADIPNNDTDVAVKALLKNQYSEILTNWLKDKRHNKTGYSSIRIEPVTMDTGQWYRAMLREPFPDDAAYILCFRQAESRSKGVLKHGPTNEHWVAIVGATDEALALACSYTSHYLGSKYAESEISVGTQSRAFNNQTAKELTSSQVFTRSRYKISIV